MPDPNVPVPVDPNAPAPAPTPMQVIISIIGSIGANAFTPNPIQANVGDMIVWTNNDVRLHHIVLDDGTDLGDVQPGQSSAPAPLMTPTAMFHCTIHPTMVGSINGVLPPDPYMPPPDDYYGYY
jgi:plastocyanin